MFNNTPTVDLTGIALSSEVAAVANDVDTLLTTNHGSGSWQQGAVCTVDANIISVNGVATAGVDDFKAEVGSLEVTLADGSITSTTFSANAINSTVAPNLDVAVSTRSTLTATGVRSELATELGRIDVATSSRLPTSSYVVPDNTTISTILAETQSHPTLTEMEASTVLAKEATVAQRATPAQVSAALATYDAPTKAEMDARFDSLPTDVDTVLTATHGVGDWTTAVIGIIDANIVSVNGNSTVSINDFKADVSGLSTFDPSIDALENGETYNESLRLIRAASVGTIVDDGISSYRHFGGGWVYCTSCWNL